MTDPSDKNTPASRPLKGYSELDLLLNDENYPKSDILPSAAWAKRHSRSLGLTVEIVEVERQLAKALKREQLAQRKLHYADPERKRDDLSAAEKEALAHLAPDMSAEITHTHNETVKCFLGLQKLFQQHNITGNEATPEAAAEKTLQLLRERIGSSQERTR